MKNASKHAETLKALLRKIAKDKSERPEIDPIRAVVRGVLAMDADDATVDDALTRLDAEFVDLNEFRVATELEVADILGEHIPRIDEKAAALRTTLHAIFDAEQTMKLDRLRDMKKAEIRQYLKDLGSLPPFAEAFVAVTAFDIAAFPVDESIHDYLIDEEIVEPDATLEETQNFLESYIKADDIYGAFLAIRDKALVHESKKGKKKK
jgi:endonuclease III